MNKPKPVLNNKLLGAKDEELFDNSDTVTTTQKVDMEDGDLTTKIDLTDWDNVEPLEIEKEEKK